MMEERQILEAILQKLDGIESEQRSTRADIAEIKDEQKAVRTEIAEI